MATKPFPQRLHHEVPSWVDRSGVVFHIRIRAGQDNSVQLTNEELAPKLLASAIEFARKRIWWPTLFLIMPDHIHALLTFGATRRMSRVVGDWKKWHHLHHAVRWQENYFDHRLRRDESLEQKALYVRRNPVVKGLCSTPEDWPWILDSTSVRRALEVERALRFSSDTKLRI
jgi:putative transposase